MGSFVTFRSFDWVTSLGRFTFQFFEAVIRGNCFLLDASSASAATVFLATFLLRELGALSLMIQTVRWIEWSNIEETKKQYPEAHVY